MNDFEKRVGNIEALGLDIIQANVCLKCNQACAHCHLSASKEKGEVMSWEVMRCILDVARVAQPKYIDITGGAPECNPKLREFISALRDDGHEVLVRTNLTMLLEKEHEGLIQFYADSWVMLVASFPCYMKKEVESVRGDGVFDKSVEALKRLNAVGFGVNPMLKLDIMYNPEGAFLPPPQAKLEAKYKKELKEKFGLSFNNLLALTNMPVGRFAEQLKAWNKVSEYGKLLYENFNPDTLEKLMCRKMITVGYDGTLYDCDFNYALRTPIMKGDRPMNVSEFDFAVLTKRTIATGNHCFGCTAGQGSSCVGALG